MNFNNNEELKRYLKSLIFIGMGSQGCCYLNTKDNTVIKIFHDYLENDYYEISEDEIMKFSTIKNKTYIWPSSIVKLNNSIIGYISNYVSGKNLYRIDPMNINLNLLEKHISSSKNDIKTISKKGVLSYDVMYNIILGKKLYVIDHEEYTYRNDLDVSTLISKNTFNFNYELYLFLIDSYFDEIINDNKELLELYNYKKEDILIFLKLFRNRLSELVGNEIICLNDAKKYINSKEHETHYQRTL